jgi:hypothetical protein
MPSALRNLVLISLICLLAALPRSTSGQSPQNNTNLYLPLIANQYPWVSVFGIETNTGMITNPSVQTYAQQLGAHWLRLNTVSWRAVQPVRGGAYNWSALAAFEQDLLAAASAKLTPIVIVDDSPAWATINQPFQTSCGAIRSDRFADFARFMAALANRYKGDPYNVHYWELGNEVDVDPRLVQPNNNFGCWGKIEDPYYGGEQYGNMLKVVTPAIRRADEAAQVLNGGLLVASQNTTNPSFGKPEKFLEGILRAGAGDSFDILAYHTYPSYPNHQTDYDLGASEWTPLGGWTVGKAHFLRSILATYHVSKPLMLNEGGLICTPPWAPCKPPEPDFFQAQADHIVRMVTRGWADDLLGILWYTLDGPGWRSGSLLDGSQYPRPVYTAYQYYISQTSPSDRPVPILDYGPAVEAYRFNKGGSEVVDILWSRDNLPHDINLPLDSFVAASAQDGTPLTASSENAQIFVTIGFSAVYIKRTL